MLLVHSFEAYIEMRPATLLEIRERIATELQCARGELASNQHAWARWEEQFISTDGSCTAASALAHWYRPASAWKPIDTAAHTCRLRWVYLDQALRRHDGEEFESSDPALGPVRAALDLRSEAQHMYWEVQLLRRQFDDGTAEVTWQAQQHKQRHGSRRRLHPMIHDLCQQASWRTHLQGVVSGTGVQAWSVLEGATEPAPPLLRV